MNRFVVLTFGCLVGLASSVNAVTLKPTPVQDQFRATVASSSMLAFDDFGDGAGGSNDEVTFDTQKHGGRSTARAALYSALLPGMGEHYLGHRHKARVFFAVEVVNWIGFIGFKKYEQWRKDDMINIARERAGADLDGKDDFYIDMVGFYDNIDEYNQIGRARDPDRPYLEDNASNHWRWEVDANGVTSADKAAYRYFKNSSREARRSANFMVGAMVLNRIVSIIDVIRDGRRQGRSFDDSFSDRGKLHFKFDVDPFVNQGEVRIAIYSNL